jgi:membrane protein implicated in regulation of membrane protease activity
MSGVRSYIVGSRMRILLALLAVVALVYALFNGGWDLKGGLISAAVTVVAVFGVDRYRKRRQLH